MACSRRVAWLQVVVKATMTVRPGPLQRCGLNRVESLRAPREPALFPAAGGKRPASFLVPFARRSHRESQPRSPPSPTKSGGRAIPCHGPNPEILTIPLRRLIGWVRLPPRNPWPNALECFRMVQLLKRARRRRSEAQSFFRFHPNIFGNQCRLVNDAPNPRGFPQGGRRRPQRKYLLDI